MTKSGILELPVLDGKVEKVLGIEPLKTDATQNISIELSSRMLEPGWQEAKKSDDLIHSIESVVLKSTEAQPGDMDSLAKHLAGLKASFFQIEKKFYQKFSNAIQIAWDHFEEKNLCNISPWQHQHLSKLPDRDRTVFYPFGGPDATYVLKLFPKASQYILVGLELLGTVKATERLAQDPEAMSSFQTSLKSFLKRGYFITSEMSTQLYSSYIRGVLPPMLLQFARLGCEIIGVKSQKIHQDGTLSFSQQEGLPLIQIDFLTPEKKKKTLYYVRCSLTNDNKEKLIPLFAFVQKNPFVTFLKSSSYALHNVGFSEVRDFVLRNTLALLQDDTGIPVRLIPKTWGVYAFGSYKGPTLKVFQGYVQKKLLQIYQNQTVAAIPFHLGYSSAPSNLLMALPPRLLAQGKDPPKHS